MGNIFKRPSRREDAIARAEYEQVTGKKMPAASPSPRKAAPPMKSTPVPSAPARSKMGPYKNNKRK